MSYAGLPSAFTGSYGSYVNVKAASFSHGGFAILFFSGQVTGIVDIELKQFGLSETAKISSIFNSPRILVKVDGENGGTLTVKCIGNASTLQLNSSVADDYYNVLIPVLLI